MPEGKARLDNGKGPQRRPVGAPPGRRAHGRAREQAILDAATELFSDIGLDATTRDLAARLGITQPLLYRYFDSKETLVERVLDAVFPTNWDAAWATMTGDRTAPLDRRLVAFFVAYSHQVLTYRRVRLLMYSGLRRQGPGAEVLRMLRRRAVEHVLTEVAPEAPPSDALSNGRQRSLALALYDGVLFLAISRHALGGACTEDVQGAIEAQVALFLDAALPVASPRLPVQRPVQMLSEPAARSAEATAFEAGLPSGLVAESLTTGGTVWAAPPGPADDARRGGTLGALIPGKNEGTPRGTHE